MSVLRVRLALLVVAGLLGLLAFGVSRPREVSEAELDRADARMAELEARKSPEPAAIPVTRRQVVVCLRGAGFSVHSAPRAIIVVTGRGMPETLLRVIGPGAPAAVPRDDVSWGATGQVIFKMPPFADETVRRAFFDCVDPHEPTRIAQ